MLYAKYATVALLLAPAVAQPRLPGAPCDLTGAIPPSMFGPLCEVARSAHGSTRTPGPLIVMPKRDVAVDMRDQLRRTVGLMFGLLEAWTAERGAGVMELYSGRINIGTAERRAGEAPTVTFYGSSAGLGTRTWTWDVSCRLTWKC